MDDVLLKAISAAQETLRQKDDLAKALEVASQSLESLQCAGQQTFAALKMWEGNTEFRQLADAVTNLGESMRLGLGPKDPSVLKQLSGFSKEVSSIGKSLNLLHSQFSLPPPNQIVQLFNEYQNSDIALQFRSLGGSIDSIKYAMEAMRTPWLDIRDNLKSLGGFAELQNIGLAIRQLSSFGEDLASQLRRSLGDWRAEIEWPANIFSDPLARATFYIERGFDSRLTASTI